MTTISKTRRATNDKRSRQHYLVILAETPFGARWYCECGAAHSVRARTFNEACNRATAECRAHVRDQLRRIHPRRVS